MSCIMPEQPYCPACKFGRIAYSDDVETYADTFGTECNWECLCTDDAYLKYMKRREYTDDE